MPCVHCTPPVVRMHASVPARLRAPCVVCPLVTMPLSYRAYVHHAWRVPFYRAKTLIFMTTTYLLATHRQRWPPKVAMYVTMSLCTTFATRLIDRAMALPWHSGAIERVVAQRYSLLVRPLSESKAHTAAQLALQCLPHDPCPMPALTTTCYVFFLFFFFFFFFFCATSTAPFLLLRLRCRSTCSLPL